MMRDFSNTTDLVYEGNINGISTVFMEPFFFPSLAMSSCWRDSTTSAWITDIVHGGFNGAGENFHLAANLRNYRLHDHVMSRWHYESSQFASAEVDTGYKRSSDDVTTSDVVVSRGRSHVTGSPPSPYAEEFESCSVYGDTADSWPCESATFPTKTSGSAPPADDDDEYLAARCRKQFNFRRRSFVTVANMNYDADENDENDTVVSVGDQPEVDQRRQRKRKCEQHQAHQRRAANQRERKRMQSINDAFEGLRAHIPTLPYEKRLSKVDTLRVAIGYIGFLAEMVDTEAHSGRDKDPLGSTEEGYRLNGHNNGPKVIIRYHGSMSSDDCDAYTPLTGHSLSWTNEKRRSHHQSSDTAGPHTMSAKIWVPEDPRHAKSISHASKTLLEPEYLD